MKLMPDLTLIMSATFPHNLVFLKGHNKTFKKEEIHVCVKVFNVSRTKRHRRHLMPVSKVME